MAQSVKPQIAIIMGSNSDWDAMKKAYDLLQEFAISCEVRISSAHRNPDETADFASTAREKGIRVIIAAAGLASHLAGIIAAHTTLPVIGVPMAAGTLQGIDALLSTVQMPPGIPVGTVGIGDAGAQNAALLAIQILALSDSDLAEKLTAYKKSLAQSVIQKNRKLQDELHNR